MFFFFFFFFFVVVFFFTSGVYTNSIICGIVKKVCYALVYLLDNILSDLELNFMYKLFVFRLELIVHLLLQFCFSRSFFHGKIRLTLLRLSIPLDDLLNIDNIYFD